MYIPSNIISSNINESLRCCLCLGISLLVDVVSVVVVVVVFVVVVVVVVVVDDDELE